MTKDASRQTISDFGDQWTRYVDNDGHYGSAALFEDILGPFAGRGLIADKVVLDIGSGTGRIVAMLLASGARQVVAVEPSAACDVLRSNVAAHGNRVRCLNVTGDALPEGLVVDSAVSIGVLHHIPEPDPVMRAVHHALKPGGAFVAWLYGREGNGLYLAIVQPLRAVTTRLPHRLLDGLCHILNGVLALYVALARRMPVPMRSYVTEVISPLDRRKRHLVIYDQLNPRHADYYTRAEARALFERAGFVDVELHHRHGYSWTVLGRKPGAVQP